MLTGPDHLSALATLSANVGNCRAFWYGVRWGVGHSLGLIVVGSIFIFLSHNDAQDENATIEIPERLETVCEAFVGLFMLLLGSYTLVKAFRKRDSQLSMDDDEEMRLHMNSSSAYERNSSAHSHSTTTSSRRQHLGTEPSDRSLVSISHTRVTSSPPKLRTSIFQDNEEEDDQLADASSDYSPKPMNIDQLNLNHPYQHDHDHLPDMEEGYSKQFLSVCIGIVHGVAGPGGVLGVIPAVQLHNLWLSIVYLGSFCITSTIVMGTFAASYGICSSRLSASSQTFEFRMEVFSSSLSIFVGFLWLTLVYLGKLHDIFP